MDGVEEIAALAGYLSACVAAAGDPAAIPPGPWDAWSERAERDPINVERAVMLPAGEDPAGLPPSMLRAIGL